MIVALVVLQALTAKAIAPPVRVTAPMIRLAPTAAARALSVRAHGTPPQPMTVTLQCIVGRRGQLSDCIPAPDGGARDIAAFRERLYRAAGPASREPAVAAAMARMPFYRLAAMGSGGRRMATVLIRETVRPDDAFADRPSSGSVARGDVMFSGVDGFDPEGFYPPAALRDGAQVRMTATCRVLHDRSLLCRDPRVDLPPLPADLPGWRIPRHDAAFGEATVRALAGMRADPRTRTGEDSVGRDVIAAINWAL